MAAEGRAGSRLAFQGQVGIFPFTQEGRGGVDANRPADHRQSDPRWGVPRDGRSTSDGEDEDIDSDGDEDEEGLLSVDERNNIGKTNNHSSCSSQSCSGKTHDESSKNPRELNSPFGSDRAIFTKDLNGGGRWNSDVQLYQTSPVAGHAGTITVAESGPYYAHGVHAGGGLFTPNHQELGSENGCGTSGGKEVGVAGGYWEVLRSHLSDPLTDILMDDAMILSCGHSYGSGGIQHIYKMKSCFKCGQPIKENSVRPNLALRAAVQAFCREEEWHPFRAPKRRRGLEQESCSHEDTYPTDLSRGKSVHFPFAVSDRVMIKGNKRTPQRFVGRVAVVTAQCLNGWYVLKTLDNAESVKLQYRSLEKVADNHGANPVSNISQAPNWL